MEGNQMTMLDPLSEAADRSFGETEAFIDILNWSADRPPWQKDALRRLVLGMSLSDGDIDELMLIKQSLHDLADGRQGARSWFQEEV